MSASVRSGAQTPKERPTGKMLLKQELDDAKTQAHELAKANTELNTKVLRLGVLFPQPMLVDPMWESAEVAPEPEGTAQSFREQCAEWRYFACCLYCGEGSRRSASNMAAVPKTTLYKFESVVGGISTAQMAGKTKGNKGRTQPAEKKEDMCVCGKARGKFRYYSLLAKRR